MKDNEKIASLTSLRFFAICIIAFGWHFQHFLPISENKLGVYFPFSVYYGWLLTDFFFMLSGFGMMFGYGTKIVQKKLSFGQFILRRLTKIYPLLLFSLLLVTVGELFYENVAHKLFVYEYFDFLHFLMNLFVCQDGLFTTDLSFNGPAWCISVFLILYIVFFAIFRFSKNEKYAVLIYAVLANVGYFVYVAGFSKPIFNGLMSRGFLSFSLGVIISYLYKEKILCKLNIWGSLGLTCVIGAYLVFRLKPNFIGNIPILFMLFLSPMLLLGVLGVQCVVI